jgi:hypothetical protein
VTNDGAIQEEETMNQRTTHHLVILVAFGAGVFSGFGCSADVSTDEQARDEPSTVDTAGAELSVDTQSEELEGQGRVQSALPVIGILTTICGVKNSVQGIPDSKATEFELGQTGGTLKSGDKVSLFDSYNKSFVKYGERTSGINLTWDSKDPLRNIELHKPGGGVIRYGDKVAIRVDGGGFLKYGDRRWGIKLNWVSSNASEKPYEWEVRGGETGQPVPKNKPVRLFNTVENDNVVYCRRPWGINLAWAKDCADVPIKGRLRTDYCP